MKMTKLKVNNDGVLVFTEFTNATAPSAVEGGIVFIDNELYLGL